jgi:hypothetical protein
MVWLWIESVFLAIMLILFLKAMFELILYIIDYIYFNPIDSLCICGIILIVAILIHRSLEVLP